jgi:hypothetical protein
MRDGFAMRGFNRCRLEVAGVRAGSNRDASEIAVGAESERWSIPQVAMSFLGAPGIEIGWRRSLADAEDYAVEGGDSSGVTEALGDWAADGPDALGDWAAHVNEERLAAT